MGPDERLEVLEGLPWEATRDNRAEWIFAAVAAALILLPIIRIIYWSGFLMVPIVILLQVHRRAWKRTRKRQAALAVVLDQVSDFRFVPSLLSSRLRILEVFGAESTVYRSLTLALERLLPRVEFKHITEYPSPWRQTLSLFFQEPPKFPALTLEALRLAPGYGDSTTLKSIARMAAQFEWGPTVSAEYRAKIREAAIASDSALREALDRRKQTATLLRPSDAIDEPPSTALLRASTDSATRPDELLQAVEVKSEI